MSEDPTGPDLAQGMALAELPEGGKLLGHVGDEPVLLVRQGAEAFAVGAHCTSGGRARCRRRRSLPLAPCML